MLKIGAKQDSSLKKACADADKNLAKLNKSAKAVGKVAIAATGAAAAAVATAGVAAVKSGIDYQKQLANVSTLLTGTEAEISARTAEIGKGILKVSNDTGVETANLTDGMYQVISAFGDGADAMSILETSAKAAAAGNATTTDSVNLLSAVMKGYNDVSAECNGTPGPDQLQRIGVQHRQSCPAIFRAGYPARGIVRRICHTDRRYWQHGRGCHSVQGRFVRTNDTLQ